MTTADQWHMTAQQQSGSLAIMVAVVACIIAGIWLVVRDVNASWSIDDFEADLHDMACDLCLDRDQHWDDDRDAMRDLRGVR